MTGSFWSPPPASATAGAAAAPPKRWSPWWATCPGACRLRRTAPDTWSGDQRAIRAFRRAGFIEGG